MSSDPWAESGRWWDDAAEGEARYRYGRDDAIWYEPGDENPDPSDLIEPYSAPGGTRQTWADEPIPNETPRSEA